MGKDIEKNINMLRRNVKDSIFTYLFRDKQYVKMLYEALYPDANEISEKDITLMTLTPIITIDEYNDLSFMVQDILIVFIEAQNTKSVNVLIRILLYVAKTLKQYFGKKEMNLYGTKPVRMPQMKFYILYTGKEKIKEDEWSLNDVFYGGKGNIDLKVQIIKESKKADIIWQYIEFTKVVDKIRDKNKKQNKDTFALEVIDECIKKNILKKFFIKHREEAIDMLAPLFKQETVTKYWLKEEIANAREEGMQQGMQQGREEGIQRGIKVLKKLIQKGFISEADAAREMGMSEKKFRSLLAMCN